jgi:uncharacterized protein YdeI (YjbR/CyaY-like superfamily)
MASLTKSVSELSVLSFDTSDEWFDWLEKHHSTSDGIWIRFFKKSSGVTKLNYDQALEGALCYGWIDSQVKGYDDKSWIQKYTPRRSKSIWSKINTEHIARLIKEGKMKPAGLAQVEAAKSDGRWDVAYHPAKTMTMPDDFLKELAKNKKAEAFFKTLNKTNTYAIGWRLQTAKKQETRERRMKAIIEMLSREEKLH